MYGNLLRKGANKVVKEMVMPLSGDNAVQEK